MLNLNCNNHCYNWKIAKDLDWTVDTTFMQGFSKIEKALMACNRTVYH